MTLIFLIQNHILFNSDVLAETGIVAAFWSIIVGLSTNPSPTVEMTLLWPLGLVSGWPGRCP